MAKINKGIILWNKATKIIPGGNGLLSKRPDRFLPKLWPTYYSKCKGIEVWDLDNKKYTDFSNMGIGTSILGYSNSEVNRYVKKNIDLGVSCTLNSSLEYKLAKKLLDFHPEFQSVKFSKTGGEALTIAIRIARAHMNSTTVAFSGYHGWHDWYLATNLQKDSNLNEHLLPGLKPSGVPKKLINSSLPIKFNDPDNLIKIFSKKNYPKILIVEGARYDFMNKKFINAIKKIQKNKKVTLIIDEITSGWRVANGGAYKTYGLKPDIVVYGKSIGNGFPITAILGKKNIMDFSQDTFISSTFWTESSGFAASIKTIEIFSKKNVSKHLIRMGNYISKKWKKIAKKHNISISINEFKPLITFNFKEIKESELASTIFTQEMLKEGYLATNSIYLSYCHNKKNIDRYLISFEKVISKISIYSKKKQLNLILDHKIRSSGFKRLT